MSANMNTTRDDSCDAIDGMFSIGKLLADSQCPTCKELPEMMDVTVPAELSYTGAERPKCVSIDACIAPIVKALNDGGVKTTNCCCGHGRKPGWISLADGRELRIFPDMESATC